MNENQPTNLSTQEASYTKHVLQLHSQQQDLVAKLRHDLEVESKKLHSLEGAKEVWSNYLFDIYDLRKGDAITINGEIKYADSIDLESSTVSPSSSPSIAN